MLSIVILYSTFTRALTVQNIQAHNLDSGSWHGLFEDSSDDDHRAGAERFQVDDRRPDVGRRFLFLREEKGGSEKPLVLKLYMLRC